MSKVECNTAQLVTTIIQIGERVQRGVSAIMTSEGKKMQEIAVSNAPVDKGNLEAAIKLDVTRTGVHGRTVVELYVDTSMDAGEGKTVGDYLAYMHEALEPYGSGGYNLGPKSVDKQNAGHDVGGKFLERAIDERIEPLADAVNKLVGRT